MESQDQRDAANKLVRVLRKATRLVQLIPFVYLFFYAIYMLISTFADDSLLYFLDSVLTVRFPVIIGMLVVSKLFELCIWHKIACLIPGSSQIENYIDNFIITFTQNEIIIINLSIGLLTALFLIKSFRHFAYGR